MGGAELGGGVVLALPGEKFIKKGLLPASDGCYLLLLLSNQKPATTTTFGAV